MTHILALDLSGRTGWARWREGMAAPAFGVARLAKGEDGAFFASYRDFLTDMIASNGVDHVVYETVFLGPGKGPVAEKLYGLLSHTLEVAYRRDVAINGAMVEDWRGHFIGVRRAPAGVSKAQRRKWLKARAMEECHRRGWKVSNDDEADACGILTYERARLLPKWGNEGPLFGYLVETP